MADLSWYVAETITIVQCNYPLIFFNGSVKWSNKGIQKKKHSQHNENCMINIFSYLSRISFHQFNEKESY